MILVAARPKQPAHCARDVGGLRGDLPPGQAENVVSECFQFDVAGSVGFEGGAAGVGSVSVEFDDEALLRPEKIGNEGAHADVHAGPREAVAAAEGEEARLQFAAGVVGFRPGIQWQAEVFGLPQRCSELRLGKETTEIREGSGWGRDGDAGSPGYCAGEEGAGPMDADSSARPSIAWDRDVYKTPLGKELPQRSRADVAEDGVGPASEHRRHPSPSLAESLVPDGVNTSMKAVQALGCYAAPATPLVDTCAFELRKRDHPVLISRNPGNDGVRSGVGAFPTHVGR